MKKNQVQQTSFFKVSKRATEPWKSERKWNAPRWRAADPVVDLCRYTAHLFNDLQPNCIKDDAGFDRRLVSVDSSRMMKYSSNVFCQNNKDKLHPQGINLSKYRKLIFMDALCSLKECTSQTEIWEKVNYNSMVKWILQQHMNKFCCSGLHTHFKH